MSQKLRPPVTTPSSNETYDLRGPALDAALCDASAFRTHSKQRISWLHVPKTGTGFMATVLHYACPRLPELINVADLVHEETALERQREASRQQAS